MIVTIFLISIALLFSIGIYLLTKAKTDRQTQLLVDLGLVRGVTSPLKSPFYKWGWRKSTDDRVWGERIVREAFEKQNIGLNHQDLEFFSQVCSRFASGGSVDKSEIIDYVKKIFSRGSTISNMAYGFIAPIFEHVLSASPQQAKQLLEREKIRSSTSNAPDRLVIRLISKLLKNHGMNILCSDSGMDIKNESGDTLASLKGYDGWNFWLKSCRESVEKCLGNRTWVKTHSQAKFFRSQIKDQLIQSYINHIQKSRTFIRNIEQILKEESIPKSKSDLENLERIFYRWHFSDGIHFSLQNMEEFHHLLILQGFPSRFRQALLDSITDKYESLLSLLIRFPRHIIFMGINPEARTFAAHQYLLHFSKVIQTISTITRRTPQIPLFLRIFEDDVNKARNPEVDEYRPMATLTREEIEQTAKEEDNTVSGNTGHIPLLIDSHKRLILFEKNLDAYTAEKMGWILEIQVEDFTPKEYAQLDLGQYLHYQRIHCDKIGDFPSEAENKSFPQKRITYFNTILDKLLTANTYAVYSQESELEELEEDGQDKTDQEEGIDESEI